MENVMSEIIRHINVKLESAEDTVNVLKLISAVRPQWNESQLKFKVFKEGISNTLFAVHTLPELSREDAVLIRIYGRGTEAYIDRDLEAYYLRILHHLGFSGDVFIGFQNGLCYEYVPGNVAQLWQLSDPIYSSLLAKKLARLHNLPFDEATGKFPAPGRLPLSTKSCLFERLRHLIELLPADLVLPIDKSHKKSMSTKQRLLNEASFLEKLLENASSPVVFCHNDLLAGNIITTEEPKNVEFIDFEYCGYNHAAYDIANHFCEYSGTDKPNHSLYPSSEYQRSWLVIYLEAFKQFNSSPSANDFIPNGLSTPHGDVNCVADDNDEIEQWLLEIDQFSLASHLLWASWAFVQAVRSTIDFDFYSYGVLRLNEYRKRRSGYP